MSATYYEDEGVTVCISDDAYRMYAADAAAAMAEQDAKERRQNVRSGVWAGGFLIAAAYVLYINPTGSF
jgi:hypothetical protein